MSVEFNIEGLDEVQEKLKTLRKVIKEFEKNFREKEMYIDRKSTRLNSSHT